MARRPHKRSLAVPSPSRADLPAEGFALWREAMRWQRAINTALKPLGLTHTQFLVLVALERAQRAAGDAVNQRSIAKEAGLDASTTSNVLATLERRGLVDRGITQDDARAWRVITCSAGIALLRRAAPAVDETARRFFSGGSAV